MWKYFYSGCKFSWFKESSLVCGFLYSWFHTWHIIIQWNLWKPTTSGAKEISRFSEVPVLWGSVNRRFRSAYCIRYWSRQGWLCCDYAIYVCFFTFFQCVIFVIVFKCVLNKNKYCRNLFYKCVHVLSVKSTTRFQVTDLIGFVACCRIFFMLYKNHRARCSNNGIQYSIQLMTLLTEMIPETTGVKIRLNTKRPHTNNNKKQQ